MAAVIISNVKKDGMPTPLRIIAQGFRARFIEKCRPAITSAARFIFQENSTATRANSFFSCRMKWGRSRVPAATPMRITVPTLLERQGNFSQTRDGSGIPVFIKDPLKTGKLHCRRSDGVFPGQHHSEQPLQPVRSIGLELVADAECLWKSAVQL